jgi:hypothetical protein
MVDSFASFCYHSSDYHHLWFGARNLLLEEAKNCQGQHIKRKDLLVEQIRITDSQSDYSRESALGISTKMKVIKIVLSLFIFLLALAIGLNVPIIASGTQQECNNLTGSCSTPEVYLSFMEKYYPCDVYVCTGTVDTVTLAMAYLYSGSLANSTSGATAYLYFSLNNPKSTTYITSLTLSSSDVTQVTQNTFYNGTSLETVTDGTVVVYSTISERGNNNLTTTLWDNDSHPSSSHNLINFNSKSSSSEVNAIPSGTVTTFTYYPAVTASSSSEKILSGQVYNYVITFANGQSVSGSLAAE